MSHPIFTAIKKEITDNPVLLYMKGTPTQPQCGFSSVVCQILSRLGVPFVTRDVMTNPELRQGIKDFTSWPTIPQLYVKGEFVGGCDIVKEMYHSGDLQKFFEDKGITITPS